VQFWCKRYLCLLFIYCLVCIFWYFIKFYWVSFYTVNFVIQRGQYATLRMKCGNFPHFIRKVAHWPFYLFWILYSFSVTLCFLRLGLGLRLVLGYRVSVRVSVSVSVSNYYMIKCQYIQMVETGELFYIFCGGIQWR